MTSGKQDFTLFVREEMNHSTMGFSIVMQIVQTTIGVVGYDAAFATHSKQCGPTL